MPEPVFRAWKENDGGLIRQEPGLAHVMGGGHPFKVGPILHQAARLYGVSIVARFFCVCVCVVCVSGGGETTKYLCLYQTGPSSGVADTLRSGGCSH